MAFERDLDLSRGAQTNEDAQTRVINWYNNLTPEDKQYLANQGFSTQLSAIEKWMANPGDYAGSMPNLGSSPLDMLGKMERTVNPEGVRDMQQQEQLRGMGLDVIKSSISRQAEDRARRTGFLDQADQARTGLIDAFGRTQDVAQTGMSPATQQLQDQNARTDRNMLAMANSQTAGSGMAARGAASQIGMMNPQQAAAEKVLRRQEMINARQQLGGMAGAIRSRSLEGAQLGSGSEQGYVNAALSGISGQQGQVATRKELEQARQDMRMDEREFNEYKRQQERQAAMGTVGAITGAAGSLMSMASDERLKTETSAQPNMDEFLGKLTPYTYNYTKEGQAMDKKLGGKKSDKRQLGIMAQDLERSSLGKNMVAEKDGHKTVDIGKAAMASLAANAYLKDRIDQLESALGGAGKAAQGDVMAASAGDAMQRGFAQQNPLQALLGRASAPQAQPSAAPAGYEQALRAAFAKEQPFAAVASGRELKTNAQPIPSAAPAQAEQAMRSGFQQANPFEAIYNDGTMQRAAQTKLALQGAAKAYSQRLNDSLKAEMDRERPFKELLRRRALYGAGE